MPIPLRFHVTKPAAYQAGDCWYGSRMDKPLSTEYETTWKGKRPPICVVLPKAQGGEFPFCPDEAYAPPAGPSGWTVTGSPEDGTLTVRPSIDCSLDFHGWITNGIIYPLGQS